MPRACFHNTSAFEKKDGATAAKESGPGRSQRGLVNASLSSRSLLLDVDLFHPLENLHYLERGTCLEELVIVGEGMQALNENTALSFFDQDVAQRSPRHPAARIKKLAKAVGFGGLTQLFMDCPKEIGPDAFDFESRAVGHVMTNLNDLEISGKEGLRMQLTSLGQQLSGGAHDFRNGHRTAAEGDDMSIASDIQTHLILRPIDHSLLVDLEKLGMHRPSKDIQGMLGNLWSN